MRNSVIWFLAGALLLSALTVVCVRHQHRIASSEIQTEENRRDTLNEEWGQLLIEENLWAFPHRIERDAIRLLGMRAPSDKEVQVVMQAGLIQSDDTARANHETR